MIMTKPELVFVDDEGLGSYESPRTTNYWQELFCSVMFHKIW